MSNKAPVNTFEQIADGDVFLSYSAGGRIRPRCTRVVGRGFNTDPETHWMNNGCKAFYGPRAESLPAAKKWASEKYGVKRWRRNGFGDWVDASKNYPKLKCEIEAAETRAAKRLAKA